MGFFGEADVVVADAKTEFFGVSLEFLDVTLAGLCEAVQAAENPHGRVAHIFASPQCVNPCLASETWVYDGARMPTG